MLKANDFKKKLSDFTKTNSFIAFVIASLLMTAVYAIMEAYPFGKSSVLIYDLNAQYIYFFEGLRNAFYGDGSLLYSFQRSLGGEFMGIFTYYLASPLSYIVLLFPKAMITEALFLILVLKTGLTAAFFAYFLDKSTKLNQYYTLCFSIAYALSSFAVVQQHNTMWMDGVALLPLIVTGLTSLVKEKKFKFYTISLACAMLFNYYIALMICIFLCLYFVYLTVTESVGKTKKEYAKFFLDRGLRMGIFSIIAALIACIMIIPAYYGLTFGKTDFSTPSYDLKLNFTPFSLIYKSCMLSYDTLQGEGLPFIWCGTFVLIAFFLFYLSKKITLRDKIASSAIILVLVGSMMFNPFDLFWHAGQTPNCLNYRYAFILIFMGIFMAARACEDIRRQSIKPIIIISSSLIIVYVLTKIILKTKFSYLVLLVEIGIILLYTAFLILSRYWKFVRKNYKIIVSLFFVAEFLIAGVFNLWSFKNDVGGSSRGSYVDYFKGYSHSYNFVKEYDKSPFYRMEKLSYRTVNDSYASGYYGLSGSTSTLNADTLAFLKNMGVTSEAHWSKYEKSIPTTDSILGIKYVLSRNDDGAPNKVYEKIYTDAEISVYENKYALPLIFGAKSNLKDTQTTDNMSTFEIADMMYSDFLGENLSVSNSASFTYTYENCAKSGDGPEFAFAPLPRKRASIVFTLENSPNMDLYIDFGIYECDTPLYIYVNDEEYAIFDGNNPVSLIYLGNYPEKSLKIEIKFDYPIFFTGETMFCFDDYDILAEAKEKINEHALNITKFEQHKIEGNITAEGNMSVFTSIPYDSGWNVKVDGVKVDTYEAYGALLAFDISDGEHEIKMSYFPKCYKYAIVISLTGISIFVIIAVLDCKFKKKNKEED